MLKNYFKIAFRNILKHKGYSLINIFGLAIGMTCCLLIMLYVNQELNYDRFHENNDRIYRVALEVNGPEGKEYWAQSMFPLAPAFKIDYPEVERIARIFYWSDESFVKAGGKEFFEKRFVFADSELFDIFTFPVIQGKLTGLLDDKSSIVITRSTAEKYFGASNPIGQVMQYDNQCDFNVVAVIEDIPVNSHFHFDIAAPISVINRDIMGFEPNQWGGTFGIYTYALLPKNISLGQLENITRGFVTRHGGERSGKRYGLFFQPLKDIHLLSHMDSEIETNNFVSNLIVISLIGLFILCIAVINFVNLTTARVARRTREVGIRKSMGALRSQLMWQYIGESVIFSLLALVCSLVMVELALPYFSKLVGKTVLFSFSADLSALLIVIAMAVVVGILSGIYPALFLSGKKITAILKGLKGSRTLQRGPVTLIKILVTLQFVISIILIIGTIVVLDQLAFFKQANLGFNKDYTVSIPLYDQEVQEKVLTVKQELERQSGVIGVTACMKAPIGDSSLGTGAYPPGKNDAGRVDINLNFIDFDFIPQFGLQLVAGRNFSKQYPTDKTDAFIINETAAKRMGFASPDDALGKRVRTGYNRRKGIVVGVTQDFHIASLYENIEPLLMMYKTSQFSTLAVKIKPHNARETIARLEQSFLKFSQKYPFQFSFLDQQIAKLYAAEEQTSKIIGTFAGIAIFIACMGLFGMASLTAEQRRKEIGVRKVLGASVRGIVLMMSKEFTRWVLLANLIAWPTAYLIMNHWLQNFPYHTTPRLLGFVIATFLTLAIAWLSVGYQSLKAALANPVEALRYE
jgi:putative ABC transport system permease protein